MSHTLKTHYRGADLTLEAAVAPASVNLRINGLVRDSARSTVTPITLKVSSTVQTDYEWHEFIEATVDYRDGEIHARLTANNQELASETWLTGSD